MNRTSQLRHRALALGLTLFSVSASIITVIVRPATSQQENAPRSLPTTLTIQDWHLQRQAAITSAHDQAERYDRVLQGQRYHYQRHHQGEIQTLTVELRDVTATESDIGLLQSKHLGTEFEQVQIQDTPTPTGHYRLFTQAGTTDLHSCLSSENQLSVTADEFQQQSYRQALTLPQIAGWLSGQRRLLNDRCLWIRISHNADTPVTSAQLTTAFEQIYPQLKQ